MKKIVGWITLTSCFLTGCMSIGPKYTPPLMEVPCEWGSDQKNEMNTDSVSCFVWWEALRDPLLISLIERAAQQNLDVSIAISRIQEARRAGVGMQAGLYPHIDATVNYGHVHYPNKILRTILGKKNLSGSHRDINFFEAGFDAEWEIDLFGKTAHEINASCAEVGAAIEGLRDTMVSLSAEIAKNYIELRGQQALLNLTEKNIEAQKDAIKLTQGLVSSGFSSIIDQWHTEEQLRLLSAEKPLIELAIKRAIHRLSILLGCFPGELSWELTSHQAMPQLPCYKPLGIPSELLRNRPDIRQAERELAAATERVGSAMADLFPRLSLRGFIGDLTTHLSQAGFTWFAGPQLLAPIFNSRLIQQDIDLNKIKTERAFYTYQKTVLYALEETENAIASFHQELERHQQLALAKKHSQEAYEQTFQLYERGLKDYLEVLVAQRSLIALEDAFLKSQIQLHTHFIALYKALGGGWEVTACCFDDS